MLIGRKLFLCLERTYYGNFFLKRTCYDYVFYISDDHLDVWGPFPLVYREVVVFWFEQILQLLIVDLEIGQLNAELCLLFGAVYTAEESIHHPRNHTLIQILLMIFFLFCAHNI